MQTKLEELESRIERLEETWIAERRETFARPVVRPARPVTPKAEPRPRAALPAAPDLPTPRPRHRRRPPPPPPPAPSRRGPPARRTGTARRSRTSSAAVCWRGPVA